MGGHLRLRDDTILQLKQEGYAMQKRIKELTSENDELKRQLSPAIAFTTDGMQVHNHYSIPIHTIEVKLFCQGDTFDHGSD
ncbi:MAG: hypothetical protein MJE68_05885 [Proteobacteria bacterium]|nr:hypothetical protein [Pseudomonadota bacterium]